MNEHNFVCFVRETVGCFVHHRLLGDVLYYRLGDSGFEDDDLGVQKKNYAPRYQHLKTNHAAAEPAAAESEPCGPVVQELDLTLDNPTDRPLFQLATLVVYGKGRSTIFRMPIYPMLNQWNANPMTPNPGL